LRRIFSVKKKVKMTFFAGKSFFIIPKTHIFKNIMHVFLEILCVIKNNIVSLQQNI